MKKDYNIDFLRVISMLLVIVIHVANYYGRAFDKISKLSFLGEIIFNVITRVSIPIFFMISGALLLNKNYDSKKNIKRIRSKLISLVIMSLVYYFWDKYYMHNSYSLIKMLGTPGRSMLWFMYAIIALYIALPFIKAMIDNMDEHLDKLFVILWLFFNGVLYLVKFKVNITYPVPIVSGTYYLGYFIIGYLILKYKDKIDYKKYNWHLILISLLCFITNIFLTYFLSQKRGYSFTSLLAYRNILMMIPSLAIFILIYFNRKNRENKFIEFISPYSFGIYLVHGILLNVLMNYFDYIHIISFVGIPICTIILLLASLLVVYILKKVPLLRNIF